MVVQEPAFIAIVCLFAGGAGLCCAAQCLQLVLCDGADDNGYGGGSFMPWRSSVQVHPAEDPLPTAAQPTAVLVVENPGGGCAVAVVPARAATA